MREVKFRGKSQITGEWVAGTYIEGYIINGVIEANSEYIVIEDWKPVHPESVGQYTGMKDDENNEIWEGNIVQFTSTLCGDKLIRTVVEYNENIGSFVFEMGNDEGFWQYDASMGNVKVIGNIYDNPEL